MEMFIDFFLHGSIGIFTWGHILMLFIGCVFLYLAIAKGFEPLLLVPIGFGILIGNIPVPAGLGLSLYEEGSVLNFLYKGIEYGIYPPLIFLGIGAMTDFSIMLSQPRLMLLGAAAQVGVFITFIGCMLMDFPIQQAAAIGIIGGADGPTSIFIASKMAPELLGAIALAGYSYMALVPVIQPPVIYALTTKKERLIRMKRSNPVSQRLRIAFPIIAFIFVAFLDPGAITLVGMLFFGNMLRESGVTERLAATARTSFIDIVTIILGVTVGASTDATRFLVPSSMKIFGMGAVAFVIATASGVLFAKLMNVFSKDKINPIIGAAGVSAVPLSARVCQTIGAKEDPTNFLIMHAMAPNVAGVVGSAIAAGFFLSTIPY